MTVEQQNPDEAFKGLAEGDSALVDVRTVAEWSFVGLPDLSAIGIRPILIEWARFPDMSANPDFVAALDEALGGATPKAIYFICRSGARSMNAARAAEAHFAAAGAQIRCINVAEGFEGDLDADGHRGGSNGWKARGLPWRQN
ncbi:rhodanese-like domain-containing protein [Rhodovulum sp. DZ06]|uniref:rhodanese-like domain-containing protein n=1 Tax=Rhodovulum sp. DZ06 TaxID=3425126 RepID=UPI003D34FB60